MVQLSLLESCGADTLGERVRTAEARWTAACGCGAHITEASAATSRRFSAWSGRGLAAHECSRIDAYYAAVVRRTLFRIPPEDALRARRRLVAATIKADLIQAGWSAERAADEAARAAGLPVTACDVA